MINHNTRNIFLFIMAMIVLFVAIFIVLTKDNKTNMMAPVVVNLPDIEVVTPKDNEVIRSPLKISGIVRGNGWSGFEGQVGKVTLLDSQGKELATTVLLATTEWTQLPINFKALLNFDSKEEVSGTLLFYNENPSGEPYKDKVFIVPIKFK